MQQVEGRKVLIVDDDEDIRALLCQVLRKNFRVYQASGGDEAWEMLQAEHFDAVVSDMRMPEGAGDELLVKIKQQLRTKVPVIIITAYSDHPADYLLRCGADAVFPKPFDYEQVISSLTDLTSR